MALIEFYCKGELLTRVSIKEGSNQAERDAAAECNLCAFDYQTYDKFTITDDNGNNPRSAELTGYFQDSRGQIWKLIS